MEAEKVLALEVDRVRSSILLLQVWSCFYDIRVMMVVRSPETSCSVTEALCCAGLGGLCGVQSQLSCCCYYVDLFQFLLTMTGGVEEGG